MSIDTLEDYETEEIVEPNGSAPSAAEGSPLERLRALRKEKHEETTQVFPLPGYNGELGARYRVMPWEKTTSIQQRALKQLGKDPRADIHMFMDELIQSCVEIVMPGEDGEWEPLYPDRTIRYGSPELAEGLGIQGAETAREILRGVFSNVDEARADYLINAHHTEVTNWMRGAPDDEEDLGALGEAEEAYRGE
jgi:hypothetical protein